MSSGSFRFLFSDKSCCEWGVDCRRLLRDLEIDGARGVGTMSGTGERRWWRRRRRKEGRKYVFGVVVVAVARGVGGRETVFKVASRTTRLSRVGAVGTCHSVLVL